MDTPRSILDPELARRLQTLNWDSRRSADGIWVGAHRSRQFGSSVEFAEHKEYAIGDDLRHLDWKAYARFDRYTIKKFENETSLRTLILLDASASMAYGDGNLQKIAYARVLAAALAYLALRQDDATGLFLLDETARFFLPPRASTLHFQEISKSLLAARAENKTDLARALDSVAERVSGRFRLVLLSDAFDAEDAIVSRLARLRARGGEVALLHVLHPDELALPFDYLCEFIDLESGEHLLADPEPIRVEYRRQIESFFTRLSDSLAGHGIGYLQASTASAPIEIILRLIGAAEVRA